MLDVDTVNISRDELEAMLRKIAQKKFVNFKKILVVQTQEWSVEFKHCQCAKQF